MSRGITGNLNLAQSLYKDNGRWVKREEQCKLERRAIKTGYPIEKPFESVEEIKKYLSGDKLTCLLCGKEYKSLGSHLRVHTHTEKTYKELYKIPSTWALMGIETIAKKRENMINMRKQGVISEKRIIEGIKQAVGKPRQLRAYKSVLKEQQIANMKPLLNKCSQIRKEKSKQKTYCGKGHLLPETGMRKCPECTRINMRKIHGYLPREESLTKKNRNNLYGMW